MYLSVLFSTLTVEKPVDKVILMPSNPYDKCTLMPSNPYDKCVWSL